jgi:hypothetical protein
MDRLTARDSPDQSGIKSSDGFAYLHQMAAANVGRGSAANFGRSPNLFLLLTAEDLYLRST